MDWKGLIRVDREEFSALVGAVKEIAAAVKRIEDRLDHMDGRMTRMEDRMTRMEERQERMETDLQEFRKESREHFLKIGRRIDHHDHMLMDHDRRITEVEAAQADSLKP